MKQNLILLSMAILLTIFTYYYQELGEQKAIKEQQSQGIILNAFDVSKLNKLYTPNIVITRTEKKLSNAKNGKPINPYKLKFFLKQLESIRIRSTIPNYSPQVNHKDFFPNGRNKVSLQLADNRISLLLGKKLDYSQDFYMKIVHNGQRKIVVAYDQSPSAHVYTTKDAHRSATKYNRLINLYQLGPKFFEDRRIIKLAEYKQITLLEQGRKIFTIYPATMKIIPEPPASVSVNKNAIASFINSLKNMEGESMPYTPPTKSSEIKTLRIKDIHERHIELTAFKTHKSAFIGLGKRFYKLQHKAHVFNLTQQSFWDLRALKAPPESFNLTFGQHQFPVKLNTNFPYKAIVPGHSANNAKLLELASALQSSAQTFYQGNPQRDGFKVKMSLQNIDGKRNLNLRIMLKQNKILVAFNDNKTGLIYDRRTLPIALAKAEYIND